MTIHPRRKQAIAAFASGTTVIVDLNCPSNVRAAPRSSSRNLNSMFGVGRWAFLIPDLRLRFASPRSAFARGYGATGETLPLDRLRP